VAFSICSVSFPSALPTPFITGVGAARLNTGKVVMGRGVEREMTGGSGRPAAPPTAGDGLDRETGVRPLSTTLDLSLREDFVVVWRAVAGGATGRGLGWGLGVLLVEVVRGEDKPLLRLTGA